MTLPFYEPTPTDDPLRFRLEVTADALAGKSDRLFLMGGVSLASAICAMEQAADRPLIWAAAQFLSGGGPNDVVDIDVELPVIGGKITQARTTSRIGDRTVVTVTASLGGRDDRPTAVFLPMPDVPAPQDCDEKKWLMESGENLHGRFERRSAYQSDSDGIERLWFRPTQQDPITPGLLAIVADFLAGGHSLAAGSSSLDNTLRIHNIVQSEWILLDTQFSGFTSGAFHGHTHLFSQDGMLLATAGQTGMLPKPGTHF